MIMNTEVPLMKLLLVITVFLILNWLFLMKAILAQQSEAENVMFQNAVQHLESAISVLEKTKIEAKQQEQRYTINYDLVISDIEKIVFDLEARAKKIGIKK